MKDSKTFAIAFTTALVTATVTVGAPAVADAVVRYARNADKVDGKHAVPASASTAERKGKLVATSGTTGRLPNNIIGKAADEDKLDGRDSYRYALTSELSPPGSIDDPDNPVHWTKIAEIPEAIRDGKDAIGPSVFAHIDRDGSPFYLAGLEAADIAMPDQTKGTYCFDLPEVPVHVEVTPQYTASSDLLNNDARAFGRIAPAPTDCIAPHAEAMVTFRTSSGAVPRAAFFVSFMFPQP